jgi:hypothetical protein
MARERLGAGKRRTVASPSPDVATARGTRREPGGPSQERNHGGLAGNDGEETLEKMITELAATKPLQNDLPLDAWPEDSKP